MVSIVEETAQFDPSDLTDVTAIEDGDGYKVISLKLSLTYEGTEISDEFTASEIRVTSDSEFWKVEYLNSSGEEDWSESMDVQWELVLTIMIQAKYSQRKLMLE